MAHCFAEEGACSACRCSGNEKWNDPEMNHPTGGFLNPHTHSHIPFRPNSQLWIPALVHRTQRDTQDVFFRGGPHKKNLSHQLFFVTMMHNPKKRSVLRPNGSVLASGQLRVEALNDITKLDGKPNPRNACSEGRVHAEGLPSPQLSEQWDQDQS